MTHPFHTRRSSDLSCGYWYWAGCGAAAGRASMELERISVVLRPRAPREALDLGAAMLRANARAVWSAWFAFTLPIFVLCNALGVLLELPWRSEEHTSELQSLMRISYAVFCL